jgi:hypothetical protein
MEKIKRVLLIFIVDTFIMLVSWAGLSLINFCVRVFSPPEVFLTKTLPLYSFLVVLSCYAFYLIYGLVLVEDYTSLFFLLGAISGFLVFLASRLRQSSFGKERLKESPGSKSESMKLPDLNRVERNPAAEK